MSRNLVVRIAFAVVAIPLAVLIIYAGDWILAGMLAVLGVLGTRELYDLGRKQGIEPIAGLGLLGAAAVPLGMLSSMIVGWPYALAGWLMAVLVVALATRTPAQKPLSAVALTVLGPFYASWMLAFVLKLRSGALGPWQGTWLVLLPLVATWTCDTAAMGAGSAIGGPKLAPVVSPKKTWAGAIGGLLGALAATVAIGLWVFPRLGMVVGVLPLIVIGVAIGILAQVGDVAESLFKREVGVKDSSALIPGHGGVLDRLDSLYFVLPATAGLFWLFRVP
ncbi:MAG TPA: phosphatidate cytidylyltransferase [Gemmatimonadales bacterium]|jgi:phosphatidate cytidylyltransferase|nr:phosphatidate cytidylyltransferase [Gemmatimonadales bacterium]